MFITWIISTIRREIELRRTAQMLRTLNDRELADIGLERWEIAAAVRGTRKAR